MAFDSTTAPVIERQPDDEVVRSSDSDNTSAKKTAADVYADEKQPPHVFGGGEIDPESLEGETGPLETAEDIVTHVIGVDDDPTLSPWTFRMFFVGECGPLSLFPAPGPQTLTTVEQVSVSLPSAVSSRRSCTSSRRWCTCR